MKINKQANEWLKENKNRLEETSQSGRRHVNERSKAVRRYASRARDARDLKAKYLAHPLAQHLMTFQQFRDVGKRDAICCGYGIEPIRV